MGGLLMAVFSGQLSNGCFFGGLLMIVPCGDSPPESQLR